MRFVPILLLAACGRCNFGDEHHPDALETCTPQAIIERVELGAHFACAQLADRTLRCWGDGSEGQLGTGDFASSELPVEPLGLGAVDSFALGNAHACAVITGNVYCWGRNHTGQIGNNSALAANRPVRINAPPNITTVAAGGKNTCAITAGGELWCWGQEHGTVAGTIRIPTRVMGVPAIAGVSLGSSDSMASAAHGCALGVDGTVWCFGWNTQGQLGRAGPDSDPPVQATLSGVEQVVAGDYYTCARTTAREVYCWGMAYAGRLGDGAMVNRPDAGIVDGLADVVELDAHRGTTCARTGGGEVYCWGENNHREIPVAETAATRPVKLPFAAARSIAVGTRTACALEADTLYCWGAERFDRPGNVHKGVVTATVQGVPLNGIDDLRASGDRTCAHRTDNALACWGEGSLGQHGDGTRDDRSEAQSSMTNVQTFGLGLRHTCALRGSGAVACWGDDEAGQTTGTGIDSPVPVLVPRVVPGIGESIVALAAGGSHTCARATSGNTWCWGNNAEGQLCAGTSAVSQSSMPPAMTHVLGGEHTCVIAQATNAVMCCGRNNENQIDSMISDAAAPRQALVSADAVTTQRDFNCARVGASAVCWGDNTVGQLTDGTYTNTPVAQTAVAAGVVDVVAGSRHACARTTTNETWCWGANDSGQLGDGTQISTTMAVRAPALDGVVQLALGERHTCGRNADGTVRCVGSDRRGQLGDGGTLVPATPTPAAISCP